jgi:hypothetical protein
MVPVSDTPKPGTAQPFDRSTVDLLVSLDHPNCDPSTGFYVTTAGKQLSKAQAKAVRLANPADHAQASLILEARRDAALARYEDKRRLGNDLLQPYDAGASSIEEIAVRIFRQPNG